MTNLVYRVIKNRIARFLRVTNGFWRRRQRHQLNEANSADNAGMTATHDNWETNDGDDQIGNGEVHINELGLPVWSPIPGLDVVYTPYRFPQEDEQLPDFIIYDRRQTMIALYGEASWEALAYCFTIARYLCECLIQAVSESSTLLASRSSASSALPASLASETSESLLSVKDGLGDIQINMLRRAQRASDAFFVPSQRLHGLREPVVTLVQLLGARGFSLRSAITASDHEFISRFLSDESRKISLQAGECLDKLRRQFGFELVLYEQYVLACMFILLKDNQNTATVGSMWMNQPEIFLSPSRLRILTTNIQIHKRDWLQSLTNPATPSARVNLCFTKAKMDFMLLCKN
jgi:hypothetical protein